MIDRKERNKLMALDTQLREQLRTLLEGENAHMTFEDAVANFPLEKINTKPPHVSYTPWHLLEHLRRAQWDQTPPGHSIRPWAVTMAPPAC